MAITTQQQSNIIALTVGMFNAAPGAQFLSEFANIFENNGQSYQALADALASTNQYQSQFNGIVTQDGRIDKVLSNLGIQSGTDAYTTAKAHFEARIAEGASETELVVESLEYLLGDDAAAEFADVQAQLNNKVEVATFYSVEQQQSADNLDDLQAVVSSVTADDATVEAAKNDISNSTGQTFTLTASADNFVGTAGNDTFVAAQQNNLNTLAAGDTIDGGAGTDRLNIFGDANIAGFAAANVSNVEQVYAQFSGTVGANTLNVSANADVQQAWVSKGQLNGADVVTLTKAQTAGIEGTVLATNNNADTLTFNFSNASAAAGDVASLALNGANVTTTGSALANVTINAIETLNVSATGANRLGTLNGDNSLATLNVAGAGSVNATVSSSAVRTVNAADNTGGVTLNLVASAAQNQTITGGTGNDIITTTYAGLSNQDTINLGAGVDSLIFTDEATFNTVTNTARLANVTNVEKLGTVNNALIVNGDFVSQNIFTTSGTGSFAITDAANNTTLEFGPGTAGASTTAMKLGANTLNVELNGGNAVAGAADVTSGLTVTGSSTINLETNGTAGGAANILALTAASNQNVVITGSQGLTLTTTAANGTTGFTIDGSAATGVLNITGTGNADTIIGGSGADTIFASAGKDTITLGAGNDVVDYNVGTESFVGATLAAQIASIDVITDFAPGADKLNFVGFAGATTFVAQTTVQSAVGNAATLEAAFTNAATAIGTDQVGAFQFGGNTYVLAQDASAALADTDLAVQLNGLQTLTATDFVLA